ncbi:MAG: nitrous oxide reductase accessory protein NosL [Gemmatimonadota bacterium]|nr:nitrous oxide reductase accessory protein NosL [Gemmatimonadota bacterium]
MTDKAAPGWARLTVLVASLALLAAYVLPLWKITLEAPQYPEGLGMLIRVNTIEGIEPNDLDNINNLNHYIGMKRIEPDSMAELRFMPWILGFLVAWGVAAAAVGRRWMLCAWFGLLALGAAAGLADFWRWGYDYGHNLDVENAIIEVPGMTYQPPVIGSKKLLNFTAHSWPASGGWIAIAAGLAGAIACLSGRTGKSGANAGARAGRTAAGPAAALALVPFLVVGAACAPDGPATVRIGEDVCDHCRMTIEDRVFAAQLVTERGKAYRFDAIECLAGWVVEREGPDSPAARARLWVADAREPGRWIRVEDAAFLHGPEIRSPMGGGLAAVPAGADPGSAAALAEGAERLDWDAVLDLARAGRITGHRAGHGGIAERPGPGPGPAREHSATGG